MVKQKLNIYITKEDALEAITEVQTRRKEDYQLAIRALKGVPVKRSRKLSMMYVDKRGEEICPHCHKKLDFYAIVNPPPKFCYCLFCGGAIQRAKGNKNGYFDYSLLEGRPQGENDYPERPTTPQHYFAKAISQVLKIPLPEVRSKQNYNQFIKEHQSDYYRAIKKKKSGET